MTAAAFTVILPHKRNAGNDAALSLCLDCLMANTHCDFALSLDAAADEPLQARINRMVRAATTELCLIHASDMFFSPNWDVPMLHAWTRGTFVTNVVVEPGAIALHGQNKHMDFGRKPETFRRDAFEAWAVNEAPMLEGEGWFCPYLFNRDEWLAAGGLEEDRTAIYGSTFNDADTRLFDRWKAAGNRIVRAQSYVYHLQRWSDQAEQTKAGR